MPMQFKALLTTVEAFDKHSVNQRYLKYKPVVSLSQGKREWWRYAIRSVLEEDVKRRLEMWSWNHIKLHRWAEFRVDHTHSELSTG